MTELDFTMPPDLTPAEVRGVLNAQKHINEITSDRLDAAEDAGNALRNEINAIFKKPRDGTPYTATESVMALDHRMRMKEGELMALWSALDDLKGELQTIRYLIAGPRRHIASSNRSRPGGDGASPFESPSGPQ